MLLDSMRPKKWSSKANKKEDVVLTSTDPSLNKGESEGENKSRKKPKKTKKYKKTKEKIVHEVIELDKHPIQSPSPVADTNQTITNFDLSFLCKTMMNTPKDIRLTKAVSITEACVVEHLRMFSTGVKTITFPSPISSLPNNTIKTYTLDGIPIIHWLADWSDLIQEYFLRYVKPELPPDYSGRISIHCR